MKTVMVAIACLVSSVALANEGLALRLDTGLAISPTPAQVLGSNLAVGTGYTFGLGAVSLSPEVVASFAAFPQSDNLATGNVWAFSPLAGVRLGGTSDGLAPWLGFHAGPSYAFASWHAAIEASAGINFSVGKHWTVGPALAYTKIVDGLSFVSLGVSIGVQ